MGGAGGFYGGWPQCTTIGRWMRFLSSPTIVRLLPMLPSLASFTSCAAPRTEGEHDRGALEAVPRRVHALDLQALLHVLGEGRQCG
eukprot:6441577-Pyramimonas_sp.AAC.1